MITVLPAPPHVAAFAAEDTLNAAEYDRCIEVVEERLAGHERIAIYFDMRDMTAMTPAALGKDVAYALRNIGDYHRFARGAIVTDSEWLAAVVRFAGGLFPQTDLRTFPGSQREQAMAWVSEPVPDRQA